MKSFLELRQINVANKMKKKGRFNYLSWAWAVDTLLQEDPSANWEFKQPMFFSDSMMVFCSVTAFGKTMTAHLPVMDNNNKPIPQPDANQVNKAMQRCLVKAIALHGIALYIYEGEDLPDDSDDEPVVIDTEPLVKKINEATNIDELKKNYIEVYKVAKDSPSALAVLEKTKDEKKKTLEGK